MSIYALAGAALALVMLSAAPAAAQDYPDRPVRIVVGFAAGSVSDLTARAIAQKLGSALGQPFIVEVRPGAGSNVAAQYVVRAPRDGYTLFVATSSSTIRAPATANLGFDFATDLTPIALLASVPFVLTAYRGLGVKTVPELIALAKARPETLTFGGDSDRYDRLSRCAVVQSASRHEYRDRTLSKYCAGDDRSDDGSYLDRIRVGGERAPAHRGWQADGACGRAAEARCHDPQRAVNRRGRIAGCLCQHLDRYAGTRGHAAVDYCHAFEVDQ